MLIQEMFPLLGSTPIPHNLAPDPAYEDVLRQMAVQMWQRIHETDDFNMVNSHYGMFRYAPVGPGKW